VFYPLNSVLPSEGFGSFDVQRRLQARLGTTGVVGGNALVAILLVKSPAETVRVVQSLSAV
jgi:hypothetical protein